MIVRGSSRRVGALVLAALAGGMLAGCATAPHQGTNTGLHVVAAENFWGSIAAQLAGSRASVASIITSPDTDPHSYEATAADARAFSDADVVVVNGVGYDPWATKLLAANPASGRTVVNVGDVVGASDGDNPHRWYDPDNVHEVVGAITAAYQKADPNDSAYFAAQQQQFETSALAGYDAAIAAIKSTYAGTPVGASESIFAMLAPALGLDLVTPPSFLRAISEGTDPTVSDKRTIDRQITQHEIDVYVYNSQNATPDVQAQVDEAEAAGIPVTTITETLSPANATFQEWQVRQLQSLQDALAKAVGK